MFSSFTDMFAHATAFPSPTGEFHVRFPIGLSTYFEAIRTVFYNPLFNIMASQPFVGLLCSFTICLKHFEHLNLKE